MAVLVIGGCGFIGKHVVSALNSSGIHSVVFDKSADSKNNSKYCTYVSGDMGDLGIIKMNIEQCGITHVIHLVSTTLPKSSNEDMRADLTSNVVQMLSLLDLFVEAKIEKILFMSSGGTVYGNPEVLPVREDHPTDPICSYGIGKLAIEKYLALYKHLFGLDYVVLRAANPYGLGQNPFTNQGIIANFVHKMHCGLPLEVWGDGQIIRDYFDVRDLAMLTQGALFSQHLGIYNAGSGIGISINDIITVIASTTHLSANVIYKEQRMLDVPAIVLDCAKAEQAFGWRASISLEVGVADYIRWYLDNYGAVLRPVD